MRDINRLKNTPYDLVVIGGGINGAAVANLASKQGLLVALIEKNDFASGTSSKSTKLIHGGIRYLENLDFGLVKEALKERYIQWKVAPHLVNPIEITIPVYENDRRPLWLLNIGSKLYDFLSGIFSFGSSRKKLANEILEQNPGLNDQGLVGGVTFFDSQMDDARLCLENVLMARKQGADVFNYVEFLSFQKENGKTVSVYVKDRLTNERFSVKAKRIVSALGPWTNSVFRKDNSQSQDKIRTTKGVHIVYKDSIVNSPLFVQCQDDKRFIFMLPFHGHTLIGTTDDDYRGNLDKVTVSEEDLDYLMSEVQRMFPKDSFSKENILTSFAGLRPLVMQEGAASGVSRKHLIEESYSGVFYIYGGKYTTYRKVAEECLSKIIPLDEKLVSEFSVYGSGEIAEAVQFVADEYDVDDEVVRVVMDQYGARYRDVLNVVKKDKALGEFLSKEIRIIKAQIVYAVENEMAITLEDVVERRLSLPYRMGSDSAILSEVQRVFQGCAPANRPTSLTG